MATILWTQRQDIGPSARAFHAMAFDAPRQRTVLFGGASAGETQGDTWEWDGSNWTQVENAGPSARGLHAMAFHESRGRTVLFGGETGGAVVADTWEWDGADWTQVADSGPAARMGHALVHDAARDRLVLFGGRGQDDGLFGDTWIWASDSGWSQVQDVGPAPRDAMAMAYDPVRTRVVLYGGTSAAGVLSDTWEWDGTDWSQAQDVGPPPLAGAAMVYDGDGVLLFGGARGADSGPDLSGASWEWCHPLWTQRQDIGPAPRVGHAMGFDSVRGRPVLFGGSVADPAGAPATSASPRRTAVGDTWEASVGAAPSPGMSALVEFNVSPSTVTRGEEVSLRVRLEPPNDSPTTVTITATQAGMTSPPADLEVPPGGVGETSWVTDPNMSPDPVVLVAQLGAVSLQATLMLL